MGDESSKKAKKEKKEKKEKKDKKDKKRSREEKGEGDRGDDARSNKKAAAVSAAANGVREARDGASADRLVTWDSFEATCFPSRIKSALASAGFTSPSEIQKRAWPPACEGRDVVAVAKTGSGKTLAFLLPTVYRLGLRHASDARSTLPARTTNNGNVPAPDALVLAPTRELALQIHLECEKFGACEKVRSACVYGGAPAWEQKNALKSLNGEISSGSLVGFVVVATPGRLCDLMAQNAVTLNACFVVTLDEADRMLDMGFEPQLREVFAAVPAAPAEHEKVGAGRQTTLFTATWPKSVRKLAGAFLAEGASRGDSGDARDDANDEDASDKKKKHAATRVFLGGGDGADAGELSANKAVTQRFIKAQDDEKDKHMYDLLSSLSPGARVVAFANTKRRVEMLSKTFWNFGFGTVSVHGDKQQKERELALKKFVDNECPLMFATDVAARGLDIKGVTHVVNFDMARDVESYVHRIGRTGRAGEVGESVTFWNPDYDIACSPALCKIARDAGQEVPEWLAKYEKGKESKQWKVADAVLKS
jgi:superfamily II DNA/RNA helicase